MSRGDWGILAAFAGLAALFTALFTGAYYGSVYAPEKRHYQSVGPNSGQTYPADSPRNGLADVAGIDRLAESLIAKPEPRNTEEREQRDLAAQETMAVFGYWVFWAMIGQTCLAAGALIALVKDLRQNRRSAELQLRAYLYVELKEAPKLEVGGCPKGEFWLRNGGQTPAYNVRTANALSVGKYPFEGEPAPIPEDAFKGGGHHAQNSPTVIFCRAHEGGITQPWIDAINEGTRRIVMYGEIRYDDVFGKPHVTKYRAEFGGPETHGGGRVVWSPVGNDAT